MSRVADARESLLIQEECGVRGDRR